LRKKHRVEYNWFSQADEGHGQNDDRSKRLQVQSKRINLVSLTMNLFSELLTKFQLIELRSFCSAVIR